ncbi:hypothetical protein K466DRAFT_588071 [Polyporus arcularius HHB13444]|uniref:Uncharacterized protein n=1 Tax=Polyporus arcularius HHB13444 TaxID=1314778 RepID=A0A5C3PB95_9APHY|nr:hypothetical protein K466DRAFT_588071 [Polyporus arcularius HHB13444]
MLQSTLLHLLQPCVLVKLSWLVVFGIHNIRVSSVRGISSLIEYSRSVPADFKLFLALPRLFISPADCMPCRSTLRDISG